MYIVILLVIVTQCLSEEIASTETLHHSQSGTYGSQEFPTSHNCHCVNWSCWCCAHWTVVKIHLNDTVCANVTYLYMDFGLQLTLTVDKHIVIKYTVSAKNPPPVCIGVPYLKKYASLCVKFYNISYSRFHLTTCVKILAKLVLVTVEDFNLGCFTIPPSHANRPTIDSRELYDMAKHSSDFRHAVAFDLANRHSTNHDDGMSETYADDQFKRVESDRSETNDNNVQEMEGYVP